MVVLDSWGPFLQSPEDFSVAFRVTILFVSLKRRRFEARNLAVTLIFIPVTTSKKTSFTEKADRFHKWRPVYYSFVYVLIRPTSLVLKEYFFCIFCVLTRLVGLISTETIGYFFGRHLCNRSTLLQTLH